MQFYELQQTTKLLCHLLFSFSFRFIFNSGIFEFDILSYASTLAKFRLMHTSPSLAVHGKLKDVSNHVT